MNQDFIFNITILQNNVGEMNDKNQTIKNSKFKIDKSVGGVKLERKQVSFNAD